MPIIHDVTAHFLVLRATLRAEGHDAGEARQRAESDIAAISADVANGTHDSDEHASNVLKAMLDNAMACPDDQLHALFKDASWSHCPFSGVASFRWTIDGGRTVELCVREGDDGYTYWMESVIEDEDEDD